MEDKDKHTKYITIIALLLGVVGLSFGFAAYTRAINISANVDITPETSEYNGGVLSTQKGKVATGMVSATTTSGASAEDAILTKDTISNLSAHFTKPGQSAKYSFYGFNDNEIETYLNSVVFGSKTCKAFDGETTEKVLKACDSINMTIKIGNQTFKSTDVEIKNHKLDIQDSEDITVVIEYDSKGIIADKKFKVSFGTSVLTYSTLD